jgi:hypothetical protein
MRMAVCAMYVHIGNVSITGDIESNERASVFFMHLRHVASKVFANSIRDSRLALSNGKWEKIYQRLRISATDPHRPILLLANSEDIDHVCGLL